MGAINARLVQASAYRQRKPMATLRSAITPIVDSLEARRLLSADPTPQETAYTWEHLTNAQRHLVAVTEYVYPDFAARLDTQLQSLGLPLIAPEVGTLPSDSTAAKGKSHRHPHKPHLLLHKPPRHPKHHGKSGPQAPYVTDESYYYETVTNQVAFTFDQPVTSTNWNGAVSVLDLNTGTTISVSAAYSPALDTVVYNLNNNAELANGNYAAILHGSLITDATYTNLATIGDDGTAGHDVTFNFYFLKGETFLDGTRSIGLADYNAVVQNFGAAPATYSQGCLTPRNLWIKAA